MVAGRCLWSDDQQQSPEHQACRRGDLGVEAVEQDRGRAGEARGERAGVLAGRQIDQQDDREAQRSEGEDDSAEAAAAAAQDGERQRCGEQRHREQHVGVRLAGGFGSRRRGARPGQARVAGLADLHGAVVDELRDRQAGCGAEDRQADGPLGGEYGAEAGGDADRPRAAAQQGAFEPREAAEEEAGNGPQAAAGPSLPMQHPHSQASAEAGKGWPGTDQSLIDRPIDPASERFQPHAGDQAPAPEGDACTLRGAGDAPPRCYHRASLRLLFGGTFRRAR
jgi:hypothetical protein